MHISIVLELLAHKIGLRRRVADALLLGRVTYELMEAGWRQPVQWSLGRPTLKTGAPYRCSRTRKR